jgi:hypothetical protein
MLKPAAEPESKLFSVSVILVAHFSSFVAGIGLAAQGLNR